MDPLLVLLLVLAYVLGGATAFGWVCYWAWRAYSDE